MGDTQPQPLAVEIPDPARAGPSQDMFRGIQHVLISGGLRLHHDHSDSERTRGFIASYDGRLFSVCIEELPPGEEGGGHSRLVPADSSAALQLCDAKIGEMGRELSTASKSAYAASLILADDEISPVMARLAQAQVDVAATRLASARRQVEEALNYARSALAMKSAANAD